ncbi:hypothetical protein Bca52824_075210 [Brassica carinata]|uniref:RNase H type-1 domain-containing protein n=1 Tax=Brassica carinata TaxID=52824 RepID=A0A8X7TWB1_BRACI|nr:hypothetical protein Bca52824_075210 [Brassica carinata]
MAETRAQAALKESTLRESAVEKMFQPPAASGILTPNMENPEVSCDDDDELPLSHIVDVEDFRSYCADEQVWSKETEDEEEEEEEKRDELGDEFSVKLFFKGVSITERGDSSSGYSGIGVILKRSGNFELIQVQKKLDFYAEESVANYLALLYGLTVALQNNLLFVVAVTVSEFLYNQASRSFKWFNHLFCSFVVYMKMALMSSEEKIEIPILVALRERMLEKTSNFDGFVLKIALLCDHDQALSLA